MSFLSQLANLLGSLFPGLTPESQQKQDLRRIENELRQNQPQIYKNKALLPNFGEAFRVLQENTRPFVNLLTGTICNEEIRLKDRYIGMLIETGFSDRGKKIREELLFENRKNDFFAVDNPQKIFDSQKHDLESLLKEIVSVNFIAIEKTIAALERFCDICCFSYTPLIRLFSPEYSPEAIDPDYNYISVPLDKVGSMLEDFYFLINDFSINAAMGRAINALLVQYSAADVTEKEQEAMLSHLRKVSYILTKILTPDTIKKLICLDRGDPNFIPKTDSRRKRYLQSYVEGLKRQFENDTQRITIDMQDEHIHKEIENLFGENPLCVLEGYNQENNNLFTQSGTGSFTWITPMQILKTFEEVYLNDKVKNLLNDVVVEGFFNNSQYKTDFSAIVFNCLESYDRVLEFENAFGKGNEFDSLLLIGYIRDGQTNPEFLNTLSNLIVKINTRAQKLIQNEVSAIFVLAKKLQELIPDSRRSTPEYISNLKILFVSPRNRDNFEFLETSLPQWNLFLDIMKNYAIIGDVRDD